MIGLLKLKDNMKKYVIKPFFTCNLREKYSRHTYLSVA